MTGHDQRIVVARAWLEHARDALANAEHDALLFPAGAVGRSYYACYYAASAVLLCDGREFIKHTGVRAAVHMELVKRGRLPVEIGQMYDELLRSRQTADYGALVRVSTDDAKRAIEQAAMVLAAFERLLPPEVLRREE